MGLTAKVTKRFFLPGNVTVDITAETDKQVFRGYQIMSEARRGRMVPARCGREFIAELNGAV
jgi:hypothetical protein